MNDFDENMTGAVLRVIAEFIGTFLFLYFVQNCFLEKDENKGCLGLGFPQTIDIILVFIALVIVFGTTIKLKDTTGVQPQYFNPFVSVSSIIRQLKVGNDSSDIPLSLFITLAAQCLAVVIVCLILTYS